MQSGNALGRIIPQGLLGQAIYLFFFLPFFPFLATGFLPVNGMVSRPFKSSERRRKSHFFKNIKIERCENGSETVFSTSMHATCVEILVFGAGAIGSFFGGLLSRRNHVTLIGRVDHVDAIRQNGLKISGKTSMIAKPDAATKVPHAAKPEIVLVTTKAYDTEAAMRLLAPFGKTSLFVTLQNGLDNADAIARTASRVVAGTTAHGVTFIAPGEVRHAGVGETILGEWTGVGESELVRLRDILVDSGILTQLTSEIRSELWAKLVVNASINPVAALAAVPNGRIAKNRRLRSLSEAVCREAAAVAKAAGAQIDADELVQRTILVTKRTAANRPSMLQDLDRHRRTEIDAITGAVVRAAERLKLAAPLNEALYALVRARETALRNAVPGP